MIIFVNLIECNQKKKYKLQFIILEKQPHAIYNNQQKQQCK